MKTMNRTYSDKISRAIEYHLNENSFVFHFDDKTGVFNLNISGFDSLTKAYVCAIIVRKNDFGVVAHFPLGPSPEDEDQMIFMTDFLNRVNNGIINVKANIDPEDGNITATAYCNCAGLIAPSEEMIAETILTPAVFFEKYASGIFGILFQDLTAAEAEKLCDIDEKLLSEVREEIEKLLASYNSSDSSTTDEGDNDFVEIEDADITAGNYANSDNEDLGF